jgi:hypothetical protein
VTREEYQLICDQLARKAIQYGAQKIGDEVIESVEELNADLGISAVHAPAGPTDAGADTCIRVAAGEASLANKRRDPADRYSAPGNECR